MKRVRHPAPTGAQLVRYRYLGKPPAAHHALVRLLPRVTAHMLPQVKALLEALGTIGAEEPLCCALPAPLRFRWVGGRCGGLHGTLLAGWWRCAGTDGPL